MDAYYDRLLGEAANVFHVPRSDAEELVSDVLMTVIEKVDVFEFKKGEGDFHFWVMTIFRNRVRDFARQQARTGGLALSFQESALEDEEEYSGVEKEVVAAIIRRYEESMAGGSEGENDVSSKLKAIEETLERMETWERVLLRCRALDVPYDDIAVYTGKNVKQLKVYHARVMKKFVKHLAQRFPELVENSL
jgi:RNA polymerase sigma factor (sigma-70 family)